MADTHHQPTGWVRAHPVAAFYLIAFAVTWVGWVPQAAHSHGLFPVTSPLLYLLGGLGPGVAAWVVLRTIHGSAGDRMLFGPLLRWRVGLRWFVVALALPVVMWAAAMALTGDLTRSLRSAGPWFALLTPFLIYLVQAVPEELGWRGFALPRLQERYGALGASLVIGVLGALWHLPLLLNADEVMSTYPKLAWFTWVIAISVVYTWLFNSAAGSVLLVTLFHAVVNTVSTLSEGFAVTEALVAVAVATGLVFAFGAGRRARTFVAPDRVQRH